MNAAGRGAEKTCWKRRTPSMQTIRLAAARAAKARRPCERLVTSLVAGSLIHAAHRRRVATGAPAGSTVLAAGNLNLGNQHDLSRLLHLHPERAGMSRSTPVCRLKCSKCQAKSTWAQRWGREPRAHFNVRVIGSARNGDAALCKCLTCGHTYVSQSRAATRQLRRLEHP